MFGGDTSPLILGPMNNIRVPYNANGVPQMQFDVLGGSNASLMNMTGNNNASLNHLPMKLSTVFPDFSQHKLPITLNDGLNLDEVGHNRSMWNQVPVSTGLKLSYGEDKLNSSISSAVECAMVNLSSFLSHHDNLQSELVRHSDELDQYMRIQEENIRKGITELNYHHTTSLLNALEKDFNCKIREKDAEIENLNLKNRELMDKIRKLAILAKSWHQKAKQNESLVNALRTDITNAFRQGGPNTNEGYDENMVDDAVSSCNYNHLAPVPSPEMGNCCKSCKGKEVSVLMLPCRHLCLCTDCEGFIEICPVCRGKKAGSLQVYMS